MFPTSISGTAILSDNQSSRLQLLLDLMDLPYLLTPPGTALVWPVCPVRTLPHSLSPCLCPRRPPNPTHSRLAPLKPRCSRRSCALKISNSSILPAEQSYTSEPDPRGPIWPQSIFCPYRPLFPFKDPLLQPTWGCSTGFFPPTTHFLF